MKSLVIIGPPGSGKDTQIGEIAKYVDFELISGGDIVRKLSEKNEKFRKIMDDGGLIDDTVILAEVEKQLDDIEGSKGIVFDGYPRTLHQAEELNELLLHHNRILDKAIYIALEEAQIVNRLSRRVICSLCGHNLVHGAEKCSECGGRAVRRHDDEPAVIIKRVQTFLENTLPLVNYYCNKGMLVEVDGNQSIAAVARDIKGRIADVI